MTTLTAQSKNTVALSSELSTTRLNYLLTEALEYILVGSAEDETLILWGDLSLGTQTRNAVTLTPQTRN